MSNRKFRQQEERFLLEGPHLVQEGLRAGCRFLEVIYTASAEKEYKLLIRKLRHSETRFTVVTPEVMKKLAETESPQGLMAVVKMTGPKDFNESAAPLWILINGLQDPGNAGTLIRSSLAAGVQRVYLTEGSVDPYSSKALRASAGAVLHLGVTWVRDLQAFLLETKRQGVQVLVADVKGEEELYALNLSKGSLIVIGNEAAGPWQIIKDTADIVFKIPMPGPAESLNAAVAGSIVLFEAVRQRSAVLPVPEPI